MPIDTLSPRAIFQLMEHARVADLAPLVGHTPQSLTEALVAQGFTGMTAEASLHDGAEASGKGERAVMAAVLSLRQR